MSINLSSKAKHIPQKVTVSDDAEFFTNKEFSSGEVVLRRAGLPNVIGILRRRWRVVIAFMLGFLSLSILYVLLATPLYTSTASILIDSRMNQSLAKQNIIGTAPFDTSMVDSQANVISSDSIALEVVRKFELTRDPEFVGPPSGALPLLVYNLLSFIQTLSSALVFQDKDLDANDLLERVALEKFRQRLIVKREELSYVIDVSFSAESPVKAAKLANAVTDAYIAADLGAKVQATRSANIWLRNRLIELKAEAANADRALQAYKAENNIVETGRGLLDQQSLTNFNLQMSAAKSASAEAKARLDRIMETNTQDVPNATVTDALNSAVITRLRAQFLDLASRREELTRLLGPGHIAVKKVREQMDTIQGSIQAEHKRIADAYVSDYQIALARQRSLDKSMAELVGQSESTNQAQVKARELESSADAYRSIYNSFLQKHQETEQAQTIPVNDSRIVSFALVPIKKSSPKTLLALVGSLVLGVLVGTGIAVAKELTNDVFRTPDDVQQELGLRCLGTLPELHFRDPLADRPAIHHWALHAPHSRFTETIRSAYIAFKPSQKQDGAVVVGVVSAAPKEGKTTVVANLGALVASLGYRTLVIDGDMHERSLSKALAPAASAGLLEAIAQPSNLPQLVTRQIGSDLDVLACVNQHRTVNAAEVLGSASMKELVKYARDYYDVILIEFAPMISVVDVRAAGSLADKFVLVVKWGVSRRAMVIEAVTEHDNIHDRIIGVVLNKADPDELRVLESYKGRDFANYYSD